MNRPQTKKSRILIVDDSPKNIQVVAGILQEEGFDMSFALDGQAALSLIESEFFDLILLDVIMPEMNGYEVSEILRERTPDSSIPVIFLTAKTDTDSIVKGFESGGVDYITKPFNRNELLARIKTHLALKQAKESLEEANCRLSQVNATKDKFFSIISHDLKGPFNGLIAGTEMLLDYIDTFDKEKIKHFLKEMNTSSRKVYNLLENLLLWARTQSGEIKWEPEQINLNDIVNNNFLLALETARSKNIRIINTVKAKNLVYADMMMLDTVVRNLICNAIKFTHNGGEIRISLKEYRDMTEMAVADNGVGIEAEHIDKLFKIDVKHTSAETADEKGTGLGLSICKEFVEKNGGKIWVESEPGKGSIFYFTMISKTI